MCDALADMTRQRDEAKEAMQVAVNVASRLTDMYQRERARVSRVEALADSWAAAGCDSSDDTHPPTASRMCPDCASADLRAALADRPTDD